MKYVYPAVLYKDKTMQDTWTAIFPDVEGAATCGYSLYDALEMAEDALAGMLVDWEDFKAGKTKMSNRIVAPTPVEQIVAKPDEYSDSAFVTLVKVDTDLYRERLAKLPPRQENEDEDDGMVLPETLVREICRAAGIPAP